MSMWSNAAGDLLHFQYYDASADSVLDIDETYVFNINDIIGNLVAPWELNIQTTVDLTIDLIAGWNWISFNVDIEDNSLDAVLVSVSESSCSIIDYRCKNIGELMRWWQILQSGSCSEPNCRKADTHSQWSGVKVSCNQPLRYQDPGENFWMRLLSLSATYKLPSGATAIPLGALNCPPSKIPCFPHFVRNTPSEVNF